MFWEFLNGNTSKFGGNKLFMRPRFAMYLLPWSNVTVMKFRVVENNFEIMSPVGSISQTGKRKKSPRIQWVNKFCPIFILLPRGLQKSNFQPHLHLNRVINFFQSIAPGPPCLQAPIPYVLGILTAIVSCWCQKCRFHGSSSLSGMNKHSLSSSMRPLTTVVFHNSEGIMASVLGHKHETNWIFALCRSV